MKTSNGSWDYWKRVLDFLVASLILVGMLPVLIGVALASLFALGRPILFVQVRTGRLGKPFRLFKFRTMSRSQGALIGDTNRIGSYGHFLRSTSIDELPSLLNVIKGEMSMVGPRPLLPEYDVLYSEHHQRRHLVRPGLTGLAQVSGRNKIGWNDRLDLDVAYVDARNFALDLRIVMKTILVVVSRREINQDSRQTMAPLSEGYWPGSRQPQEPTPSATEPT